MTSPEEAILEAWRINARVTTFLVANIPAAVWAAGLPASPRRTVRGVAAHLHNSRCSWMRSLAVGTAVPIPRPVDRLAVTRRGLVTALASSGKAILRMLEAGQDAGGAFPGVSSAFVWGAMPRNVVLFTAYAVSHEAHHRGQLLLMARELGHRLPPEVAAGLWQWSSRLKESRAKRTAGA
ncbi:MAG: hypothetical protein EPN53_09710 [Acidobacteria bacterium]|nr:MAG: hypothetical protein EPN53_09710 [Acidobacteriota bacterium]